MTLDKKQIGTILHWLTYADGETSLDSREWDLAAALARSAGWGETADDYARKARHAAEHELFTA